MSSPNDGNRSVNDWNKQVIEEFRANGGKVGGQFQGRPLLLLHTTGAKSNQPRIHPLVYFEDGSRYVIVAAKAGAPTNPDWYYNILAHPNVELEVGTETFKAHATVASSEERERIYTDITRQFANFADYQKKTTRIIPIILLDRIS